MANGICVYAESYKGKLEPAAVELVSAAKEIKKTTGEKIQAIVLAEETDDIVSRLDKLGVEEIYVVRAGRDCSQQDDAVSKAVAEMLKKIDPSSVLIPATPEGRSIFSRVAMKLGCGLTADCTEVLVGTKEDGSYYIRQNKPSFGENVFVTIITRDGFYPQMMTIRPGVYTAQEEAEGGQAKVEYFEDIEVGSSKIEITEEAEAENETGSILGAEVVVVGGRGVLEDDNFALLEKFAEKVGGAIGGTRPMVDSEMIPFNHQIGQTGLTIRPKICISFGVSGAIQHTEGIKDTKLFVAVNTDEDAAIFGVADYGITADLKDVLENYLAL
ncbi:MAG: electron transfer flavoprotein subunit alpha/FixB family protein [Dorea sp.]|nr:electron transfer flavoprotein subunit alpha/FixB family protein [Dorea sp.]